MTETLVLVNQHGKFFEVLLLVKMDSLNEIDWCISHSWLQVKFQKINFTLLIFEVSRE